MTSRAGNGSAGWIVCDDGDPARARAFLNLLDHHRIEYRPLAEDVEVNGRAYTSGNAWVLSSKQRQSGLLEAVMETRTQFEDDTFYDVSAWTQPLAYNLPYARLNRLPRTSDSQEAATSQPLTRDSVAWIIPWNQMQAPALLQELLIAGARVRAASKPFSARTLSGNRSFDRGTLVIHAGLQDPGAADAAFAVLSAASGSDVDIATTGSALTPTGPDLGALHFKLIKPIKPLMIVGEGTSEQPVGHTWHAFDQRLGVVPVMVEMYRLREIRISDYTHLVMADGTYGAINKAQKARIALWVREGGILIASGRASTWAESLCFAAQESDCDSNGAEETAEIPESKPYGQYKSDEAQQVIGGAIVATTVDTTHPLGYGLSRTDLPIFRRGLTLLTASGNAYSTPVRYTADPLMGGFIGKEQQDKIRNQPAVIAERKGRGLVVRFANNPLFRGFWRGPERLFNNALFMGQTIENTNLPTN
jgi:hypothetical protein